MKQTECTTIDQMQSKIVTEKQEQECNSTITCPQQRGTETPTTTISTTKTQDSTNDTPQQRQTTLTPTKPKFVIPPLQLHAATAISTTPTVVPLEKPPVAEKKPSFSTRFQNIRHSIALPISRINLEKLKTINQNGEKENDNGRDAHLKSCDSVQFSPRLANTPGSYSAQQKRAEAEKQKEKEKEAESPSSTGGEEHGNETPRSRRSFLMKNFTKKLFAMVTHKKKDGDADSSATDDKCGHVSSGDQGGDTPTSVASTVTPTNNTPSRFSIKFHHRSASVKEDKSPGNITPRNLDEDTPRKKLTLYSVWSQSPLELPIAKDLERLSKRMSVFDEKGEQIHNVVEGHSKHEAMFHFLQCFTPIVHPTADLTKLTLDNYKQTVSENMFDNSKVNAYFIARLGEESPVLKILKLCNQSCLAPAVVHMKTALRENNINYSDVHLGWSINIYVKSHPFFQENISVIHKKKEKVNIFSSNQTTTVLEFEWSLWIVLTPELEKFQQIILYVESIDFQGEMPENEKEKIRIALNNACRSFEKA